MDRMIDKEVTVEASPHEVWQAWTTSDGAKTFFAPGAEIELQPGGKYELYFNAEAEKGARGSDGCAILSYIPLEMLSFSWNAPPSIPRLYSRGPCTWVVVRFDKEGEKRTRVRLTHLGICEGEDWDAYLSYFEKAWDIVLERCAQRFTDGPMKWGE